MKRIAVFAGAVLAAALAAGSAAGQQTRAASRPASGPASRPAAAEYEKMMGEACQTMTDLAGILEKVKDVETAKAARGALEAISERARAVSRRARQMGPPPAEAAEELEKMFLPRAEAANQKVQDQMARLVALEPKVMEALAPSLPGLALGRPEREPATRAASGPASRPGKPDEYEAVTEQACGLMAEVVAGLRGIKDLATAKAAGPAFDKMAEKMKALTARTRALGQPTPEREAQLQETFGPRVEVLGRQMQVEMMRISKLPPEVSQEVSGLVRKVMEQGQP